MVASIGNQPILLGFLYPNRLIADLLHEGEGIKIEENREFKHPISDFGFF
jgi:hypothetical protein